MLQSPLRVLVIASMTLAAAPLYVRPSAAPTGSSPAMPALPASAVVRAEITDPSDSPVDSTVAPARSRAVGSHASGAMYSRPHTEIRRHRAGVVAVRCRGHLLQIAPAPRASSPRRAPSADAPRRGPPRPHPSTSHANALRENRFRQSCLRRSAETPPSAAPRRPTPADQPETPQASRTARSAWADAASLL